MNRRGVLQGFAIGWPPGGGQRGRASSGLDRAQTSLTDDATDQLAVVPRVPRYQCAFCSELAEMRRPGEALYRCDRHAFAADLSEPEVARNAALPRRPSFAAILVLTVLAETILFLVAIAAMRASGTGPAPTWLAATLAVLAALAAFLPAAVIARIEERQR